VLENGMEVPFRFLKLDCIEIKMFALQKQNKNKKIRKEKEKTKHGGEKLFPNHISNK
jgi:hypothetical protein